MTLHPSPLFPRELPDSLCTCLRSLGHFIYYPNPGNLGDELIAVATLQVFDKLGLSYEIYDEGRSYAPGHTLVYGGGGVMIPEWDSLPMLRKLFTTPGLARCVILPQSMRDCPELLETMDERFTLFLREQKSLEYASAHNKRATILPADDMAFYLDATQLPAPEELRAAMPRPCRLCSWAALLRGADKNTDHILLRTRFYRKTYRRIRQQLASCMQTQPNGRRIAWFMRRDREKLVDLSAFHPTLDLSRLGGSKCRWPEFNTLGASHFLHAINQADIIITDRLHIGIAAAMLSKQLIMFDNSYGKISGVLQQSMWQLPHIHFCHTEAELPSLLSSIPS